jgi:hypothetical protein
MTRVVPCLLVMVILMAACNDLVEALAIASTRSLGLRAEWTVDPTRGQWRAVCGYIYNDTPVAPREVRLLVEARDTAERIIDSRIVPVLGYIAPGGRTYFCSTAGAGFARYSVTTLEALGTGER